jgi:cell division protein ZapA
MAQVTVRINGYAYTVGCQDGEEEHLLAMAGEVERRIEGIKAVAGQAGEARMLVMAALLMADDLFEMEQEITALQRQLAERPRLAPAPAQPDPKLAQKIDRLARRAEEIAAGLEQP